MKLRVKKLHKDAKLPKRSYSTDSGLDVFSIDEFTIWPGQMLPVHTGIAIQLPKPVEIAIQPSEVGVEYRQKLIWECQVRPRSGLAMKHGMTVLNTPGTIDCFSKNMKIKTIDGDKNIKDISINDVIFSVNDNMKVEKDTIAAIIDKGELEIYVIDTGEGILEITENTPIYTKNGMKYVNELKKNDEIIVF